MNKCRTCKKPTGDDRKNVHYCDDHSLIGRWRKRHELRQEAVDKRAKDLGRIREMVARMNQ